MAHLKLESVMKNGDDVDTIRNIILSSYNELMGDIDDTIRSIQPDCGVIPASTVRANYRFAFKIEFIIDEWCRLNYDRINDILPNENEMIIMEYVIGSEYGSQLHSEGVAMLRNACTNIVNYDA